MSFKLHYRINIKHKTLFLLLTWIIPFQIFGQGIPTSFPQSIYDIAEITDLKDEKLDFESFKRVESKLSFDKLESANSNLGFTENHFWLRFTLSNSEDKDKRLFLETGRPITDVVDLYQIDEAGNQTILRSGDLIPFWERPFNHRKIIFPIDFEAGKSYQFYINYQSDGEVINLPLNLFDDISMIEQSYFEQLIFGIFYGLLLLAGIVYLFFYFGIGERSFLLYAIYVGSIILLHMGLDGYFFQYITPDAGWFSRHSILIFATLTALAFGRYAQIYLKVKEYNKAVNKSFNILLISLLVLMVLILTVKPGFQFYYPLVNLLGIILLAHIITALISGYARNHKPDIFFTLGILSFFAGFTLFILNNFSMVPNSFWTESSSKLGTGLEVIFLSLSMANRIRVLKLEKEKMKDIVIQKSEESNEIKSFFLSNISHEMRTPLNAIIGLTKSVQGEIKDEKLINDLEVIQFSSLGLLSAIDDVLDYSRIERKELSLEYKPFDFHKLINELRTNTEKQAYDKNLTFEYEASDQIPEFLIGDKSRTRQIIHNILGNALKFTPEGSVKLSIETKKKDNHTVGLAIKVKDTGIGIHQDKLDTILESFMQVTIDDKRKFGGFGLGLCIAKALIEQYGGQLKLESEVGVGTEVTILLDFKVPEQRVAATPDFLKNGEYDLEGKHLLIVEDNLMNQLVMKAILKKWKNTSFESAINGLEAVEMIKKGKFDLVLMDLQMPEMDGYEASHAIRNGECGAQNINLPIIAVTADTTEKAKNKASAIGMDDYMTKPIDKEELYKKVQMCLHKQEVFVS